MLQRRSVVMCFYQQLKNVTETFYMIVSQWHRYRLMHWRRIWFIPESPRDTYTILTSLLFQPLWNWKWRAFLHFDHFHPKKEHLSVVTTDRKTHGRHFYAHIYLLIALCGNANAQECPGLMWTVITSSHKGTGQSHQELICIACQTGWTAASFLQWDKELALRGLSRHGHLWLYARCQKFTCKGPAFVQWDVTLFWGIPGMTAWLRQLSLMCLEETLICSSPTFLFTAD